MLQQQSFKVATRGRGTYEITRELNAAVVAANIATGLCNVFVQHTSASLIVCENADAAVRRDLEAFMTDLAPDGDDRFVHISEGPDDMPAHVRSVLTQTSINVPVRDAMLALGTWQGIYLWEHRIASHQRSIVVSIYA